MTNDLCDKPILIVDDESSWLNTLRLTFNSRGYNKVETCQDSTKVLERLDSKEFNLLLLDLVMPGKSGAELLLSICEHHPGLPVIILSGLLQTSDIDWCTDSGAFGHCVKTDSPEKLFELVDRALQCV